MFKNAITFAVLLSIGLSAYAFEPTMKIVVESPLTPVFHGSTNLPDGAQLMLTLTRPEVRYAGQSKIVVKNGRFHSERLTYKGQPLSPGRYEIEISMVAAALNPPSVRAIIGARGENMTGQRVMKGVIDEKEFLYRGQIDLAGVPVPSAAARVERNDALELVIIQNCEGTVDASNNAVSVGAPGKIYLGKERRTKVHECIRTAP